MAAEESVLQLLHAAKGRAATVTDSAVLLDLFGGAGGAAKGYQRAGFYVVGVDIEPQPDYCGDEFIQADAMFVLAQLAACGYSEHVGSVDDYEVIHASPPCQAYGTLAALNRSRGYESKHPKLVAGCRYFLDAIGKPYVIENVPGSDLRVDLTLCGSMFGLRVLRHRYFESNQWLMRTRCNHRGHDFVGVYGDHPESGNVGVDGYNRKPRAATIGEASEAMGIDWMNWQGIRNALPPAYTEYIGDQLQHIKRKAAI